MAITKTRVVLLTIILVILYFLACLALPASIVGDRATSGNMLYISKLGFLSVTAAFVTAFIITLIFRWDFYVGQFYGFRKYRHYLRLLIKRDFVSKYRKSVLGVLWSLLNPLMTMLVMWTVFSRIFRFDIENFPVYLLSGQIMFNFFNEATTLAMTSIIGAEGVIKKVYVPKYIFPMSKMISSLVNLFFSFLAFLFVFTITGMKFTWTMLLIPLPMIYLAVFALGIAMLMSSIVVFFRDLIYLYGVLLTLWMYLTPIFYPATIIPDWLIPYYGLNPMFQFITYFRNLTMYNIVPDLWANMVCIAYALIALCVGTYIFMRRQNRYILYL